MIGGCVRGSAVMGGSCLAGNQHTSRIWTALRTAGILEYRFYHYYNHRDSCDTLYLPRVSRYGLTIYHKLSLGGYFNLYIDTLLVSPDASPPLRGYDGDTPLPDDDDTPSPDFHFLIRRRTDLAPTVRPYYLYEMHGLSST